MKATTDNPITRSAKWIFGTLSVIVQTASEECAEIAIRALPLVSPLPNAIGLFFTAKLTLGFGDWQAGFFALSAELALFGLVDVLLRTFDGYLLNPARYKAPLWAAGFCATIMLGIIVGVVYKLEVAHAGGNPVLAILPFISGVGAIALAIRRWDENQTSQTRTKLQSELVLLEGSNQTLSNRLVELSSEVAGLTITITEQNQTSETMRLEIAGLTERMEFWKTQAEAKIVPITGVLEPQKLGSKHGSTAERRARILRHIAQTEKRADVNFTELGSAHNVSDTAIKKDIEWLVSAGFWNNGDTWKPTPAGIEWAELEPNQN